MYNYSLYSIIDLLINQFTIYVSYIFYYGCFFYARMLVSYYIISDKINNIITIFNLNPTNIQINNDDNKIANISTIHNGIITSQNTHIFTKKSNQIYHSSDLKSNINDNIDFHIISLEDNLDQLFIHHHNNDSEPIIDLSTSPNKFLALDIEHKNNTYSLDIDNQFNYFVDGNIINDKFVLYLLKSVLCVHNDDIDNTNFEYTINIINGEGDLSSINQDHIIMLFKNGTYDFHKIDS